MPNVTNRIVRTDGTPVEGAHVDVSLVTRGYKGNDTVLARWRGVTDHEGLWEATLVANALIVPENTYYLVAEKPPGGAVSTVTIVVPEAEGTYPLVGLLIDPPADLDENALALHVAWASERIAALELQLAETLTAAEVETLVDAKIVAFHESITGTYV